MSYAVIADNGGSDQKYKDIVGEIYTFPEMYASILTQGTKFIYQRCGVKSMRVAEPDNERLRDDSHYFGSAEIGNVKPIGGGIYEAEIINYKHFKQGVPFRLADGSHFEVLPGYFWRNGVRRSQEEVYNAIINASEASALPLSTPTLGIQPITPPQRAIKTNNPRKSARNMSSVQCKKDLTVSLRSKTFFNDTLEITTDRAGYWLHNIIDNSYYLLAHTGTNYSVGEIKISTGLKSKEPLIYDDTKYAIRHDDGNTKKDIGRIEIKNNCVEFKGAGTSVKTMEIPISNIAL